MPSQLLFTPPTNVRCAPLVEGRSGPAEIEVVGVVGDAKYLNLREEPRRIVYRPYAQGFQSLMTFHVRGLGDPSDLAPIVRQEVRALDPSLPVFNVQTMRGRMDESLSQERLGRRWRVRSASWVRSWPWSASTAS